jgi:hypothetical protein
MKEETAAVGNHNKVKSMATQLLAKFEENAPAESKGLKRQVWRESLCLGGVDDGRRSSLACLDGGRD